MLIGFDGSDGARAAAEDLGRAGLPQDVEALVLACADVPVNPPGHPVAVEGGVVITQAAIDAVREAAERELERAGSVAATGADLVANLFPKWQVRSEAKAGSAYWGVVDTAREWEADLVVVGSHGRSAFGQFFLGSVSQQLLLECPKPVLAVKPAEL